MKRAFTLIELLVVIAIIAILAAILFPVFAQAKAAAKKTADLSNIKQVTTASHIYLSDYDDVLPLQAGRRQNGLWNFNSRALVPADWSSNVDERTWTASGLPMNSTMPYMKNVDMLAMPSASIDYQPLGAGYPAAAGKKAADTTYTFNGLLTQFSSTGVANPAEVPLWWPGFGQALNKGWNYSQPFLICNTLFGGCTFSPVATGCSSGVDGQRGDFGTNTQGTSWAFSQGQNWSFTDGHAKFRKMGTSRYNTNFKKDPWYERTTAGVPLSWSYSNVGQDNGCYPVAFRPDFEP